MINSFLYTRELFFWVLFTAYIPKPTEDRKPLAKNMILCKMKIRRRDAI